MYRSKMKIEILLLVCYILPLLKELQAVNILSGLQSHSEDEENERYFTKRKEDKKCIHIHGKPYSYLIYYKPEMCHVAFKMCNNQGMYMAESYDYASESTGSQIRKAMVDMKIYYCWGWPEGHGRYCYRFNKDEKRGTRQSAQNKFCVVCKSYHGCGEPIHGNWGEWSKWSACSKTCGFGHHERTRECNKPAPSPAGNPCEGTSVEFKSCSEFPCGENCRFPFTYGKQIHYDCLPSVGKEERWCSVEKVYKGNSEICYNRPIATPLLCYQCNHINSECNRLNTAFVADRSFNFKSATKAIPDYSCSACVTEKDKKGHIVARGCLYSGSECGKSKNIVTKSKGNVTAISHCCFTKNCNNEEK